VVVAGGLNELGSDADSLTFTEVKQFGGGLSLIPAIHCHYCGKPTRCRRSWKRGSLRRKSYSGFTFSDVSSMECRS